MMNKGSDRDIERYISTGGLMDMLEISRSTVYRLTGQGDAQYHGCERSTVPDRAGFEMVKGELPRLPQRSNGE
jgi:hypothetical protein